MTSFSGQKTISFQSAKSLWRPTDFLSLCTDWMKVSPLVYESLACEESYSGKACLMHTEWTHPCRPCVLSRGGNIRQRSHFILIRWQNAIYHCQRNATFSEKIVLEYKTAQSSMFCRESWGKIAGGRGGSCMFCLLWWIIGKTFSQPSRNQNQGSVVSPWLTQCWNWNELKHICVFEGIKLQTGLDRVNSERYVNT